MCKQQRMNQQNNIIHAQKTPSCHVCCMKNCMFTRSSKVDPVKALRCRKMAQKLMLKEKAVAFFFGKKGITGDYFGSPWWYSVSCTQQHVDPIRIPGFMCKNWQMTPCFLFRRIEKLKMGHKTHIESTQRSRRSWNTIAISYPVGVYCQWQSSTSEKKDKKVETIQLTTFLPSPLSCHSSPLPSPHIPWQQQPYPRRSNNLRCVLLHFVVIFDAQRDAKKKHKDVTMCALFCIFACNAALYVSNVVINHISLIACRYQVDCFVFLASVRGFQSTKVFAVGCGFQFFLLFITSPRWMQQGDVSNTH